eukprot:5731796-Pyramimonas_sp.AAC.1
MEDLIMKSARTARHSFQVISTMTTPSCSSPSTAASASFRRMSQVRLIPVNVRDSSLGPWSAGGFNKISHPKPTLRRFTHSS